MASEVRSERDAGGRVHVRGSSVGLGDTGTPPDPRAEEVVELRDQMSTNLPGPVSDICDRLFGTENIEAQRKMAREIMAETLYQPSTGPLPTWDEVRRGAIAAEPTVVVFD